MPKLDLATFIAVIKILDKGNTVIQGLAGRVMAKLAQINIDVRELKLVNETIR